MEVIKKLRNVAMAKKIKRPLHLYANDIKWDEPIWLYKSKKGCIAVFNFRKLGGKGIEKNLCICAYRAWKHPKRRWTIQNALKNSTTYTYENTTIGQGIKWAEELKELLLTTTLIIKTHEHSTTAGTGTSPKRPQQNYNG